METVKPKQVWNCDETAFLFLPHGKVVIAERGSRQVVKNTGGNEKTSLTVFFVCPQMEISAQSSLSIRTSRAEFPKI
jgi:hypothetical protein